MNLIHSREIYFLKLEYEKAVEEWKEVFDRKHCLENILLTVCSHADVDYGYDRGEKWATCKLCGLDVTGIK